LSVDERAERAVESLFGAFLETILVATEAEARAVALFLETNNAGRVAVLATDNSKSKVESSETRATDSEFEIRSMLGAPDEFAAVLETVFPREMAARMVTNLADARGETSEMLVTSDGNLSVGAKFFVAGKAKSNEKNTSLLAFKRELRELETSFQTVSETLETRRGETETARRHLTEHENKTVDLQSLIIKVERETLSLEMREKSLRQETERAERHRRVVAEETAQIEKEIAELQTKRKEAESNARKAVEAKNSATAKLGAIIAQSGEIKARTEAENAALNEKRTTAATSSERRRAAQSALKRVEGERLELAARLANQNLEIADAAARLQKLADSIAEIERKNALSASERANEQNELEKAAAHLKSAREMADRTSGELAELNKRAADARNERAALDIRHTEAITKLRSLKEKCATELNLPLADLIEEALNETDFDLKAAAKNVEELREKLENFGAINMLALEELADAEERLLFLTSQRKDIIDGIVAAEEALKEIKERSRARFKAAFFEINRNFTDFFRELFGGGRGEMTLLESEDVLEAGNRNRRAAAGQTTAKYTSAVGRRKSDDGNRARNGDFPLSSRAVLPA
jgi:chromosome segregation protein